MTDIQEKMQKLAQGYREGNLSRQEAERILGVRIPDELAFLFELAEEEEE